MQVCFGHEGREAAIEALFTAVFAAAEGAAEGALIGGLATRLMASTPKGDLFIYTALDAGEPVGCIAFSRLFFAGRDRNVLVLGPVAVRTDRQRSGIGQRLISHGLAGLRHRGAPC